MTTAVTLWQPRRPFWTASASCSRHHFDTPIVAARLSHPPSLEHRWGAHLPCILPLQLHPASRAVFLFSLAPLFPGSFLFSLFLRVNCCRHSQRCWVATFTGPPLQASLVVHLNHALIAAVAPRGTAAPVPSTQSCNSLAQARYRHLTAPSHERC
ncbi:hypothetical protein M441DRAFT_345404 [Trichoderma asperellum CBS 433.97]|uniref:Uncharacterized protein n=1 Tax=Trichoderma asperellum (strain ATCC 204424 / CBS 433.97 / NBRC 101777) TaxID=1042311 RepID=A0A2T3ZHJ4_TRIA4|nr:hypothetical protein M441DRAFT_345404 [Trichoderma asperellum CBS 433.97]PTB44279.1 hypothetical protein M441DRAFT_345404 [Trichoderma asperellum CBS 433.97]